MADTPDSPTLVTPDEAASILAVSVRSVRRYADEGRLVAVRRGRHVRYRLADVAALAAERGHESGQGGQDTGQGGHTGRTPDGPPSAVADVADMAGDGVSALAEVSAIAVAALRDELVALREENARLRVEVTAKAEAAGLWQGRARTLEEQVRLLTAGQDAATASPAGPHAAEGPAPAPGDLAAPRGILARLRARWGGR